MTLRDIVALVQLGFAGFATAMAVLSYRLIRLQAARDKPNLRVIESLRNFTKYTLFLSLIVIVATSVERSFDYVGKRLTAEEANKARQIHTANQQAQNCRESLTGLVGAEASNRSPEKSQEIARLVYTNCFIVMQNIETLK